MKIVYYRLFFTIYLNNTSNGYEIFPEDIISDLIKQIAEDTSNLENDYVKEIVAIKNISSVSLRKNEDAELNITQLIVKYGYSVETHEVTTDDGFILTLFRIPGRGPPVFLMHGLLMSADDWITTGPNYGLAYLLAEEGYDVWLGNARGNKHSRRHKSFCPENSIFWNFSWDEIGRFDLPAMIDYVLEQTNQTQLAYIGHSQGTTSFFVLCSERPEYNHKISIMIAFSAVAWMSHIKSPLIKLFAPYHYYLSWVLKVLQMNEFLPYSQVMHGLETSLCGKPNHRFVCVTITFFLCGFDFEQTNIENMPVVFGHLPAGSAANQVIHYLQNVVSGEFQRFNYGKKKNQQIYGSHNPPSYPVEKIFAPIVLFHSDNDWLSNIHDVQILKHKLQNVTEMIHIPYKKFNHADYLWAKDVKHIVYKKVLQLLKNTI